MPTSPTPPRFKRLLLNAILVPIVMMIGIAALLVWQIDRLLIASSLANHSDEVIARANELQKLTIDLETGLRGFLVTGETDFLAPYEHSLEAIDDAEKRLVDLTGKNDAQQQLLSGIVSRRVLWLDYARRQIGLRRQNGDVGALARARQGKDLMDAIRLDFNAFISSESRIRDERDRATKVASKVTLWLTALVALIGGGVLAVLSRGQFVRLIHTYDTALRSSNDLNVTLEHRVLERTSELQRSAAQLVDANRELEAFAYSISHDLRAPMRHISGFVALLRNSAGDRLTESEQEYVSTMYETATLAGRMVDDLLAFSRVGRAHLKSETVDMNALVAQCRRDLQPDYKDRKIDWQVADLSPARGDATLLKMAVLNLLSNAIKYTGKREEALIEVGMSDDAMDRSAPDAGNPPARMVVYFVRDNGVGFNMEFAGKLFGVFQRLHRAEEFEGNGIGLANVRRIIVRHGGRIWVDAAPGAGATFYFTLPAALNEESRGI